MALQGPAFLAPTLPGVQSPMPRAGTASSGAIAGQLVEQHPSSQRSTPSSVVSTLTASGLAVSLLFAARQRSIGNRQRAKRETQITACKATGDDSNASSSSPAASASSESPSSGTTTKPVAEESRAALASTSDKFSKIGEGEKAAVSNFFFPDAAELDMDKSMPLDDHVREFREGAIRAAVALTISIGVCLTFYRELTTFLEAPAQAGGILVKFIQLAPGEFFFVSLKVAVAVGFLLAFPYVLFEAAVYLTPALTRSERNTVGPAVLASAVLFYAGTIFSQQALAPAALGFFISYGQDIIESQFSIDQYFEFILSMGFATGLAFQVPVLQVSLGLLGVISSEQLFSIWKYVIVGSAVVGAILTPSTDPVTQLLLSGALCFLYFTGAFVLKTLGK